MTHGDPLLNRLAGHLSLSVTFDTSRGATPGAFTGKEVLLVRERIDVAARHENLREPFLNESTRGALLTGEFTLDAGGVVDDANRLTAE